MQTFKGLAISSGLVVGRVRKFNRNSTGLSRLIDAPEKEKQRLCKSIETAQQELDDLIERANPEEKDIFTFQSCLLEDNGLLEETYSYIDAGAGAAAAMERAGKIYSERLLSIDNEYLQLRSADVLDVSQRVVDILDGHSREKMQLSHPVIIASDVFMPSDIFTVPTEMILGLIASGGSGQSHASIIARSLGIPCIVQVGDEFLQNCDGCVAAMDTANGTVILEPNAEIRQKFVNAIYEEQRNSETLDALRAQPCITKDGASFELMANCFFPDDISFALEAGAQGVGLLRTESLLSRGNTIPDEQAQYEFYTACVAAAKGKPVTIRTFDMGANKEMEYFSGLDLPTHGLGLRGIRFSRQHPQFFETQLCALLRASAKGPLQIVFPMVSNLDDWLFATLAVERCKTMLERRKIAFNKEVKLGIILEVPSACLMAEAFIGLGCDFFSIGMNDLVQYTHAADRNLSILEPYYQTSSLAVKKLIDLSIDAAKAHNIPVSISGLSVSSPEHVKGFLQAGIRSFSLSADSILNVKRHLINAYSGDLARVYENL
ncbi:MAG: putative PEP-binding protein [Faecalibacterium sp.]